MEAVWHQCVALGHCDAVVVVDATGLRIALRFFLFAPYVGCWFHLWAHLLWHYFILFNLNLCQAVLKRVCAAAT